MFTYVHIPHHDPTHTNQVETHTPKSRDFWPKVTHPHFSKKWPKNKGDNPTPYNQDTTHDIEKKSQFPLSPLFPIFDTLSTKKYFSYEKKHYPQKINKSGESLYILGKSLYIYGGGYLHFGKKSLLFGKKSLLILVGVSTFHCHGR